MVTIRVVSMISRQGAPRTCRRIETYWRQLSVSSITRQGAPRTCRRIETGGRIERGKEDKFSGTYETHGTKLGSSTAPPRFIYYAPFPLLRLLSLRYASFPRTVKGEEA